MTPADKRVLETIDKWLESLEMHLKYAQLDDAAYRQIQDWPKHDRPTRWILDLARQRTMQLKAQCEARIAAKDEQFTEALELMSFLANLLGSQHLQRFIPVADPAKENQAAATESTVEQPALASRDNDSTREMPRPQLATKPGPSSGAASKADKPKPRPEAGVKSQPSAAKNTDTAQAVVVADAVRLLKWGRKWHELAELIARMAERPPVAEVRRILRERRDEIEALSSA